MYEITNNDLPVTTNKKLSFWVCEKFSEVKQCKKNGVPWIRFSGDKKLLIQIVIYPLVVTKFPDIDWLKVWDVKRIPTKLISVEGNTEETAVSADDYGNRGEDEVGTSDIATGERYFDGTDNTPVYRQVTLGEFYDEDLVVDVEKLMTMELLPTFMSDIVNNIVKQLEGTDWMEGFNKKRGLYTGNYKSALGGRNLIILDISASIPRGVSSTMLGIIETMKDRTSSDLIVTGSRTYLWREGEDLPSPQEIRDMIPLGNESTMFHKILNNDLFGEEYDHVIVFGDDDCPRRFMSTETRISVNNLHCYHLWDKKGIPGYGKWVKEICNDPVTTFDTVWSDSMKIPANKRWWKKCS